MLGGREDFFMTGIVWWDGQLMSTLPVDRAVSKLLVLYEDNHLLAVFKPSGLLSQGPGQGHNTILDICREWLRCRYSKPGNVYLGLVHRLDRPACGVLVLAKTTKSASRLSEQFREGIVHKTYLAIVGGVPSPPSSVLRHTVFRASPDRKTLIVDERRQDAREAILEYETIESLEGNSVLKLRPHTGRPHQIRVQLSRVGHPIIGDKKYGSSFKLPSGIALLAKEIRFEHPTKKAEMIINAPTPPDWPWPVPKTRSGGHRV